MNSPLFKEWVKKEREKAAREVAIKATIIAIIANTQENILDILAERFDLVPKEILSALVRKAVRVKSLEKFRELLDKVLL